MKYTHYFFVFIFSGLFFLSGCRNSDASAINTRIQIMDQSYSGTLNMTDASGTGTFISTDANANPVTVTGTWENAVPHGSAIATYADGSTLKGKFKQGILTGSITKTNADGSYCTFKCNSGNPNGLITYYSKDNEVLSYDWFYQKSPIRELISQAAEADYRSILYTPNDHLVSPLKIQGTVQSIYDTDKRTYIKLADKLGNIYICTYLNSSKVRYTQALMPNVREGDAVTVYGFLQKCDTLNVDDLYPSHLILDAPFSSKDVSLSVLEESDDAGSDSDTDEDIHDADHSDSDNELKDSSSSNSASSETEAHKFVDSDYENTLPHITLFYGELDNSPVFERPTAAPDYKDICRYPYQCSSLNITIEGSIVSQAVTYENSSMELIIQETSTGNIYFSSYDFSDKNIFPAKGDSITISGTLNGNYKLTSFHKNTLSYILCPRILGKEITIH